MITKHVNPWLKSLQSVAKEISLRVSQASQQEREDEIWNIYDETSDCLPMTVEVDQQGLRISV